MKNYIQKYIYEDNPVSFETGENIMVNATEMAKPFGKKAKDWYRTEAAREFIDAVSVGKKIPTSDLVQIRQRGKNSGTWMHRDVAIEFARWLNPLFAIWCNDRIFELVNEGNVVIAPDEMVISKKVFLDMKELLQPKIDRYNDENKAYRNAFNFIRHFFNDGVSEVSFYGFVDKLKTYGFLIETETLILFLEGLYFNKLNNGFYYPKPSKFAEGSLKKTEETLFVTFKGQIEILYYLIRWDIHQWLLDNGRIIDSLTSDENELNKILSAIGGKILCNDMLDNTFN